MQNYYLFLLGDGDVRNTFLWGKESSTVLAYFTKYQLCSSKNHRHVSFQGILVIVNALVSYGICYW